MTILDVLGQLNTENMNDEDVEKLTQDVIYLYNNSAAGKNVLENLAENGKLIDKVELSSDKTGFAIESAGNVYFEGGDAANDIRPGAGSHHLDGEANFDTVAFTGDEIQKKGGVFDLHWDGTATATIGKDVSDVKNFEGIGGTDFPDTFNLYGFKDGMVIDGGNGENDTLYLDPKFMEGVKIDTTPGKIPEGHHLEDLSYDARITHGDKTLYVRDIENISTKGFSASVDSDASSTMSLESAIERLADAQNSLKEHSREAGEASIAFDLANYDSTSEIMQILIDNGVEELDLNLPVNASADEQVVAILDAAQQVAKDAGFEMPCANGDSRDLGEPEQMISNEDGHGIV